MELVDDSFKLSPNSLFCIRSGLNKPCNNSNSAPHFAVILENKKYIWNTMLIYSLAKQSVYHDIYLAEQTIHHNLHFTKKPHFIIFYTLVKLKMY